MTVWRATSHQTMKISKEFVVVRRTQINQTNKLNGNEEIQHNYIKRTTEFT